MKVLIVEDSVLMARMIRRTIKSWADEICECDDGAKAFVLYSEQRPDWVLMDIELKETNGIAATRLITRDFPEAKIVIVTNYNDERLREAAAEAGARGYILKENLLSLGAFLNA